MGKGSGRRPTEISEDEFQKNMDRVFGERKRAPYVAPPLTVLPCPATLNNNNDPIRCRKDDKHSGPHEGRVLGRPFRWTE